MEQFNIHNVRFYEFSPEAIHCITYNNDARLLALSRADGNIEIWNCQGKPFKFQTLIGTKGSSVESLVWCGSRLFSAGLNGFIVEYIAPSFMAKSRISVTGGPTWCLALSPDQKTLAAGTEEGYVCLFDVTDEELLYCKTLKKQKGRILSIGWHANNENLVTGSVNYVHHVSIKTEWTLQFPVGKLLPNKDTIIWCVAILDDKTIVTGDSRGKACFWDGHFGTLINAVQTHQADILTMQVTPDCQLVYVTGVDPVITEVRLVDGGGKVGRKKMWVKSVHRRIHSHDVRSIALTQEGKLFSGGVDTYLAQSFYPPKTAIKYPATPPSGYISFGRDSNKILLGYKNRLELWSLGRGHAMENNRFLTLDEDRVKLAEIVLQSSCRLECCSLSPQSKHIAYVSKGSLKIYRFTSPVDGGNGALDRIRCDDENIRQSRRILWIDEQKLLSATNSKAVQILVVKDGKAVLQKTLMIPSENMALEMQAAEDGAHFAVLDTVNQISVFSVADDSIAVVMPKSRDPVTSFSLSNNEEILVTYSNMTMTIYNIKTGLCTPWGKELLNCPSQEVLKSSNVIRNASFYSPYHVFLHSVSAFHVVKRKPSEPLETESIRACKMMKFEASMDAESNDSFSLVKVSPFGKVSTVSRSNLVLYFSYMSERNLISIEINPIRLQDSLPPALKIKTFGSA